MTPSDYLRCSHLEGPNYRINMKFIFFRAASYCVILSVMGKKSSSAIQLTIFWNKRRKFNIRFLACASVS